MNGPILVFSGLVAGVMFGLMVAWGWLAPLYIFVGMGVLVLGSLVPTPARLLFGAAILGFLLSWFVSSGMAML